MLESLIAKTWNYFLAPKPKAPITSGLHIGTSVLEMAKGRAVYIPHDKRPEHIAVEGKTGQGKSFLFRHFMRQDVLSRSGFLVIDFHGDLSPYVTALIAEEENRRNEDLSAKLIVVDPADPDHSVGLNVLESPAGNTFVQVAEFTEILKKRWQLDSFGARTEELLRNSLHVLVDNKMTLVELAPLLSNAAFRAVCLHRISNPEIADYFQNRFQAATDGMQAAMREPILNKVSAFTTDPQFRHLIGQQRSTISLQDAMDQGCWVVLHLNKGKLGENAVTLASLLMAKLKNSLFARRRRSLFTWYCDEVQNLVAFDSGLETVLSEARKFGISVVFANQFFAQFPSAMQAAVLAVGTHIFFQLSSADADKIAAALDGGKRLSGILKNLQKRHVVVKVGADAWQEVQVATVPQVQANTATLISRTQARWSNQRSAVEEQIRRRVGGLNNRAAQANNTRENPHAFE